MCYIFNSASDHFGDLIDQTLLTIIHTLPMHRVPLCKRPILKIRTKRNLLWISKNIVTIPFTTRNTMCFRNSYFAKINAELYRSYLLIYHFVNLISEKNYLVILIFFILPIDKAVDGSFHDDLHRGLHHHQRLTFDLKNCQCWFTFTILVEFCFL